MPIIVNKWIYLIIPANVLGLATTFWIEPLFSIKVFLEFS